MSTAVVDPTNPPDAERVDEPIDQPGDPSDNQPDPVVALRREMAEMKASFERQLNDQSNALNYWREQSGRSAPQPPPESQDDFSDLRDAFINSEPASIRAALTRMGFISAEQAKGFQDNIIQAVTERYQLNSRYPDLANPDSEFTRLVTAKYRQLQEDDPVLAQSKSLLRIATELAAAEMPPPQPPNPPTQPPQNGDERLRRAASQGGGPGVRRPVPELKRPLTDTQRAAAFAGGYSEDDYRDILDGKAREVAARRRQASL